MNATPEQVLKWAEAYQGHDNAEGRGDNENCKWCGAWSDDDWRKPCPKSPRLKAAALIRSLTATSSAADARIARLEEALREIEGGFMAGMGTLVLAHDWHAVANLFQARARAALGSDAG